MGHAIANRPPVSKEMKLQNKNGACNQAMIYSTGKGAASRYGRKGDLGMTREYSWRVQ